MNFEFREINKNRYKEITAGILLPLTQNFFYGEWQEDTERVVRYFEVRKSEISVAVFLIVRYDISFGRSYLYIPHGPVIYGEVTTDFFLEFRRFIKNILRKHSSIFCRFDSNLEILGLDRIFFKLPKFLYSSSFQPKFEWLIDLSKSESEILSAMKKVNRYTIKHAGASGLKVEFLSSGFMEYFDKFYELTDETAARDNFFHQAKEYYLSIFKNCEKNKNGLLILLRHEGEIVLTNFYVIYDETLYWLFGGSLQENLKLGGSYLAQWRAILIAKELGLKFYNFGAVMPDDLAYLGYRHWFGFSDFKKRFGGRAIIYGDFYDIVQNKLWYFVYLIKKFFSLVRTLTLTR